MRRSQPASYWEEEARQLAAVLAAAAPSADSRAATLVGRSLHDLEDAILQTVQSALIASSAAGPALDVESVAGRAHSLARGFLDLGLDSHDATVVISRLNSELVGTDGEQLSSSTFLEYPTPAQLASHLHERFSPEQAGLGSIAPRVVGLAGRGRAALPASGPKPQPPTAR